MKVFCAEFSALAALLILLGCAVSTHAADGATILEPVTVTGVAEDRISGSSRLAAEQLKALPQGDGNLNDLLIVLPGVQAGEMTNTSLQGGEILPPLLSISGGRFYDNSFMIDGVGNNSLLDPAWTDPESSNNLPGHPQELFLDADLIGEATVYRSNVPVEFGGFTGGVVEADTIMPATEFGGKVDLRTTRASWTRFHLDDDHEDCFDHSNSVEQQPRFSKYDGGALVNVPLAEGMGLIASYRELYSRIPLRHFGETQDQTRDLQTFFVKYVYDLSDRTSLRLSYIQTPYNEERFREETMGSEIKNSWYDIDQNGYRLSAELSHLFDLGELEVLGGYQSSGTSRQAPTHYYNWNTRPDDWVGEWDKDWGTKLYSKEGGYGDLESSQESESVKLKFTVKPFDTGPLSHEVKLGYGFERVTGTFERRDLTYNYSVAKTDADVICGDDSQGCIDGQQYMSFRSVYRSDDVNETIDLHHVYLQDSLRFKRLTLRPGYRINRDNFMDNTDHDLRLAGSLDVFGSGDTLLIGGVNRYHGRPLLTYKLAEAKKPVYNEKRTLDLATDMLNPWTLFSMGKAFTQYSELDTPYSDEWTAGVDQALLGGRLSLTYIERRGKDEFATQTSKSKDDDEEGPMFTTLNNNGSSEHQEFSVEWKRSWTNHVLAVNATWQQTETSNDNYRTLLEDEQLEELVYYHGELIRRVDLPRDDYNRGYTGNLIYSARLPHGFAFTNRTRYRSGFEAIENTGDEEDGPNGEKIAIYDKVKQPESWLFDWKLTWRRDLYHSHGLQLSLEINNVFNQKVPAGAAEEIQTYELGRQFWAGMEYYF